MSEINLSFDGMDELGDSLVKAVRAYPNKAENRLRATANNFRRDVVKKEQQTIANDDVVEKNKITTTKGFALSRTRGYNENMEIDFKAKAPHFHLVENGHEKVPRGTKGRSNKGGQSIGWTPGNFVVKKKREDYAEYVMPFEVEKLIKDITKECGL